MKLKINFRKVPGNGSIIKHIDRRLSFAFSRTKHKIQMTSITLSDVNGSKGGIDKLCRMVVKPIGMAPIVVSEQQSKLSTAIDRCIARTSQCLQRQLKRKQRARPRERINASLPSPQEIEA